MIEMILTASTAVLTGTIIGFIIGKRKIIDDSTPYKNEISLLNNKLLESQSEFIKNTSILNDKHLLELKEIQSKHQQEVNDLNNTFSQKLLKIEEGHRTSLSEIDDNYKRLISSKSLEFDKLQSEHSQFLSDTYSKHKTELEEQYQKGKAQGIKEIYDSNQDLKVEVIPFVKKVTNKGIIYNDYEIQIGKMYQLTIKGFPAFKPYELVDQTEVVSEFDDKKVQGYMETALKITQTALTAQIAPGSILSHLLVAKDVKVLDETK